MPTVIPDIVPQSQVLKQLNFAQEVIYIRVVRVFRVIWDSSEMGGLSSHNFQIAAISVTGIPTVGEAHPDSSSILNSIMGSVVVTEYQVMPVKDAGNQVDVWVVYEWKFINLYDTIWNVDTHTGLISLETCKEWNSDYTGGQTIMIPYWADYAAGTSIPSDADYDELKMAKTTALFPSQIAIYTRTITSTAATSLLANGRNYVGNYNSGTFRGDAAGYWLCTQCDVSQNKLTGMNLATIGFTYNVLNWKNVDIVYAIDPRTGQRYENAYLGTDNNPNTDTPIGAGDVKTNGAHICRLKRPMNFDTLLTIAT